MAQDTVFFRNNVSFVIFLGIGILLLLIFSFYIDKIPSMLLFGVLTSIFLIIGIFLAKNAGDTIRSDPNGVLRAAIEVNNGIYTTFDKVDYTHYMATYPNQLGLLTLFRIYAAVTTDPEKLFLFQVVFICASNFLLFQVTHLLFENKRIDNITILLSHLFLPSIFYTLWIYGDIPGLFLILLSLYTYLLYSKYKNLFYLIFSALFLTLACLIRANYLVFLVLLTLLSLINFLKRPQILSVIALFIFPLSYGAMSHVMQNHYETLIQEKITYPPQKAWVVMGLSDKVASPGYWDGYTTFIRDWNDYDDVKTKENVNRDFNERVKVLTSDWEYALDFFYRKLNVTWNEPTFQSIFVGPLTAYNQTVETKLLNNLYGEGTLYKLYNRYLSVFITIVYISCLVFGISRLFQKSSDYNFLILIPFIYLIGGFTFHLFWETKSRYVFPYIYFLMPLVAVTISDFVNKLLKVNSK
ncbi:hypothetical protein ACMZ62_07465 [Streptococcus pluranimalium]